MANKQKCLKKFGLAGGRHSSKRKALGYGRKACKYTSNLKESCVLVIRRKTVCVITGLDRNGPDRRYLPDRTYFYIDIMNFICLNSNTSCHILHKTYQEPVTKVNVNVQGHQDRKYMSLNLPMLEDNLHVEYTIFMFSLSVRYVMCLYLSQSWHFLCIHLSYSIVLSSS